MTIRDRILAYLADHSEGVDDDALAAALGLRQRQQANMRCRRLEKFGIVSRRVVNGKIRNFLNPDAPMIPESSHDPEANIEEQPWYWEGNVQSVVVRHLETLSYRIAFSANTAAKQQGKDVIAIAPSGQTTWVSAKGYPKGTVRTNPRTQARHWFSHALFDLILWHGEDASIVLPLALPEQKTYRNLTARVRWFLDHVQACIYWVAEDGTVNTEEPKSTSSAARVGS